jgi:hypothetical protein
MLVEVNDGKTEGQDMNKDVWQCSRQMNAILHHGYMSMMSSSERILHRGRDDRHSLIVIRILYTKFEYGRLQALVTVVERSCS